MAKEGKLCECGCGLPTPIAKRTFGRLNIRKGEPFRFIHGHNAKLRVGDRNPNWTGDNASVLALHGRVANKRVRTHICEHCGRRGPTDFANAKDHVYTDDPNDYIELCRSCHRRFDG